jgi:hypothetical protein
MQSKIQSIVEVICGLCIGFTVSVLAGRIIYPMYGMPVTWGSNAAITLWFTGISLVRGYVVRRLFNWWNQPRQPCDTVITSRGSMYRSVRSIIFPRNK